MPHRSDTDYLRDYGDGKGNTSNGANVNPKTVSDVSAPATHVAMFESALAKHTITFETTNVSSNVLIHKTKPQIKKPPITNVGGMLSIATDYISYISTPLLMVCCMTTTLLILLSLVPHGSMGFNTLSRGSGISDAVFTLYSNELRGGKIGDFQPIGARQSVQINGTNGTNPLNQYNEDAMNDDKYNVHTAIRRGTLYDSDRGVLSAEGAINNGVLYYPGPNDVATIYWDNDNNNETTRDGQPLADAATLHFYDFVSDRDDGPVPDRGNDDEDFYGTFETALLEFTKVDDEQYLTDTNETYTKVDNELDPTGIAEASPWTTTPMASKATNVASGAVDYVGATLATTVTLMMTILNVLLYSFGKTKQMATKIFYLLALSPTVPGYKIDYNCDQSALLGIRFVGTPDQNMLDCITHLDKVIGKNMNNVFGNYVGASTLSDKISIRLQGLKEGKKLGNVKAAALG